MARFGSLRCKATAALDGGQPIPLHQRVERECLVEIGRQLLRSRGIAGARQGHCRHCHYVAVWRQLHRRSGFGKGLIPVARFHFAQRRRCLIHGGRLFGVIVLG